MNNVQTATNRFCGPAVVSIIAGIDTDKAEKAFQELRDNNVKVRAAYSFEVCEVLHTLGYKTTRCLTSCDGRTLFNLLHNLNEPAQYMVFITGHFIVVELTVDRKRYFCDNHTKTPINGGASARLGQQVLGTWKVG